MSLLNNDFPKRIILESTNHCNLSCPSCRTGTGNREDRGKMSIDLFKKIVDEISLNNNCDFMSLQGGGEPFLHPDIFQFIEYLHERGPDIRSQISTNGTLVSENIASEIINSPLGEIIFSVDGSKKETFERLRRGARHEEVVNNILEFIRMKDEQNSTIKTGVCMVRQVDNEDEISDFEQFWSPRIDEILYATYQTYTGIIPDRRTDSDKEKIPCTRFPCKQLMRGDCAVKWNGEVYVCCRSVREDLYLGNASELSIGGLFQGKRRKGIIDLHLKGKWDVLPSCRNCVQEWSF
jgi:sulfatase maturation enzyme AslB (radical SAM superfamily)